MASRYNPITWEEAVRRVNPDPMSDIRLRHSADRLRAQHEANRADELVRERIGNDPGGIVEGYLSGPGRDWLLQDRACTIGSEYGSAIVDRDNRLTQRFIWYPQGVRINPSANLHDEFINGRAAYWRERAVEQGGEEQYRGRHPLSRNETFVRED